MTTLALPLRDTWLAELSTSGASPHTISRYRRDLTEALALMASRHRVKPARLALSAIDRDDVVAALASYQTRPDKRSGAARPRSASSLATYFAGLKAFFAWCVFTERLVVSPAAKVRPPKTPGRVPKAMTAQECHGLLAAASSSKTPERDHLALLLALTAGLRLSEIASLTTASFIGAPSPTHLRVRGKGDKERIVPLTDRLVEALDAYLSVRSALLAGASSMTDALMLSSAPGSAALSSDGLGQAFDALVRRAGLKVPGRRVHACRHSFATHVLGAGADILSVSELLGHASVATTQIYLKVDPARLAAAVEANPLAQPA